MPVRNDRLPSIAPWLERRGDEMAALVEELVAIDTENPPGRGLGRCAEALHRAMTRLGFDPELVEVPSVAQLVDPCFVRGGVGRGGQTVYFHGHFDVVPAQDPAQFRPVRRDGKIVGRGTADMKGGLVSMLYGAAAANALNLLGASRVVFHFVCDEETGSAAGSQQLRERNLIDPNALAMLTAEPTGGVVWHASRGGLTLRVNVGGREAHVGHAHLGDNAFEHMLRIAAPLTELAHELAARGSMLVVGGASGAGAGFNAVPGSAWFSVDLRFNPEEDLEDELARLTHLIENAAEAEGADVAIEVLQQAPSAKTAETEPAARVLAEAIEAVDGQRPRFELCPGVLETRWYAQLGVPSFAYGPGRLEVAHGPGEFIDEAAMLRSAAVYALFAAELGRSS